MRCRSCTAENPPGFSFCGHCGAPLPRRCRQCGLENPPGFFYCGHCGADLAHLLPSAVQTSLEGERRFAVVLFADISGFTRLSEQLDAEEATRFVNRCLDSITTAVVRNGGRVDRYTGDGLMAVFGAPTAHEDDPERALHAALEMRETMVQLCASLNVPHVSLHIGVACGQVVAAGVGGRGRREYTVIGSPVTQAGQLQEASMPGQILVSEDLARHAAYLFLFQPVAFPQQSPPESTAQAPGREQAVQLPLEHIAALELVGERSTGELPQHTHDLRAPLVGREAEVAILHRALQDLVAGKGGAIFIVGEAGIGKSRLLQAVRSRTQEKKLDLTWLEGNSLETEELVRYGCFRALLRAAIGATGETNITQIEQRLQSFLEQLFPGRAKEVYPYLGRMMGIPLPPDMREHVERLDGESLKWQTFRVVQEWIATFSQQSPLVLVFEDLHLMDPMSVELLGQILSLTRWTALLIIGVYRPEAGQPSRKLWEIREQEQEEIYRELWLRPLNETASAQMVEQLLGTEKISPAVLDLIYRRTEGNPFFIEEITRSLADEQVLLHSDEGWWELAPDWDEVTIPDTIHGILQARMDRLSSQARHTLQIASCIGRTFSCHLLGNTIAALGKPVSDLEDSLQELVGLGLIEQRSGAPDQEYIFRHVLVRDTAHHSLLRPHRRTIHLHLAQALERMYAGRLADQYGVLASHYAEADRQEAAQQYFLMAGDYARSNYALDEALACYRKALKHLPQQEKPEQAARTLMKMALVSLCRFDFAAASRNYAKGFQLWQSAMAPQDAPPTGGTLRLTLPAWPVLDPTQAGDSYSVSILSQLFEGLGYYDTEEMNILPAAADRWEIRSNGCQYVFFLRQQGLWSDGTPVTARDFVATIHRVLTPQTHSPVAPALHDISGALAFYRGETDDPAHVGIRALDDWTIEIDLERPVCNFPSLFPFRAFFPIPAASIQAYGHEWARIDRVMGNGAFRIAGFEAEKQFVLERNPFYTGTSRGNVGRVECHVVRDNNEMLAMYDRGDIDVVEAFSGEVDQLARRYGTQLVIAPQLFTRYLGFRCDRPPFDDPRLRHAFARAVDHAALDLLNQRHGNVPATGGFVPPGMPGHSPDIRIRYQPDRARQLMNEAGHPNGEGFPSIRMLVGQRSDAQVTAALLCNCWREVLGVEIELDVLPAEEYFQRLNDPPELFTLAWTVDFGEPHLFLALPFHSASPTNRIRWSNPLYDQLVEGATGVVKPAQRMEMYHRADYTLVAEEAAVMPLSYGQRMLLVKPWVRHFPATSFSVAQYKNVLVDRKEEKR
ncbi:MAG: AAA family ATPase [Anaerolineae bacterium]|nr:AAA family ATPase [Anaerolineae bacterium]